MNGECCAGCYYGYADDDVLVCRRYPATPVLSLDGLKITSHFPPMKPEGWCGEYRDRRYPPNKRHLQ